MGLNASAYVIGPSNFENDIRTDRKLLEFLSGGLTAVQDSAALAVTPVSGQHQISIAAGNAVLVGRNTPASQGSYYAWSDSADTITLPAVQANPFIVAVVLRVADPQYGVVTGAVGARYDLVSGTAAASPVAPSDADISAAGGAVPGAWMRLADVRINTADTGAIPAGQITDKRGYYLPGNLDFVCTSTTRPPHKVARRIYETDTGLSYRSTGSAWVGLSVVQDWTGAEAWTASMVSGTSGRTVSVKRVDDLVYAEGYLRRDDGAAWGSGNLGTMFRVATIFRPTANRYIAGGVGWVNGASPSHRSNVAFTVGTDGNVSSHTVEASTGIYLSTFWRI